LQNIKSGNGKPLKNERENMKSKLYYGRPI
jgi:hypothetical protein